MRSKYFLSIILGLFMSAIAMADPGGRSFKEAKDLYEKGQYRDAVKLFEQAINENPEKYSSKGNYMAGLCLKKMDACSEAKVYFRKSYEADPNTGGASSLDKFKDQLKYCKITLDELKNYTSTNHNPHINTQPDVISNPSNITTNTSPKPVSKSGGFGFVWIILLVVALGAGGYWLYNKNKQNKEIAVENKSYVSDQLFNISEILFDDAVWAKYAEQYGEASVQRIQSSWQLEYSQLVDSKDEVGINQLLRKIRQLDVSAASIFNSDKLI